ncbi:hypothetical protein C8Q74DRAFT_1212586 [Fomes fomentarius]|nr:hypothetical protein C8Q74DRAFT_1212586 [Fomes fomentarius]
MISRGTNRNTGWTYKYFVYEERVVERLAWEKHGGPVGLWHILRMDREKHIKAQGDDFAFYPPQGYRHGRRYDVFIDKPPFMPDRYCHDSNILIVCKQELPPWIWTKCNAVLDRAEPVMSQELREQAMCEALEFIRERPVYSRRPDIPLSGNRFTLPIFAVLKAAPKLPPGKAQGTEDVPYPDGLERRVGPHGSYDDWGDKYLEKVFAKLIKVKNDVEECQHDLEVWTKLRWLVYDKYTETLDRGLHYDRVSETWSDFASEWLEGRMSHDALQVSLRGRCQAGIIYNDSLPTDGIDG